LEASGGWATHTVDVTSLGMPAGTVILKTNLRFFFYAGSGHDGFIMLDNVTPISGSGGNPGDSCGSGKVLDCALNCVDQATAQSWIGDGFCDDENSPYGIVLTCPEFNNDGGDCGGGGDIAGTWILAYDWGCQGLPFYAEWYINGDGTFTSSDGFSGTWSLNGGQVTITYSGGAVYTGTVTENQLEGTMVSPSGSTGCWSANYSGGGDHPNNCTNAYQLTYDSSNIVNGDYVITINGGIESPGDVDWFKVTLGSWWAFVVATTEGSTDTYGAIYNQCGVQPLNEDDNSGNGSNFQVFTTGSSGQTFYIRVSHANTSGTGPYTLKVTLDPLL